MMGNTLYRGQALWLFRIERVSASVFRKGLKEDTKERQGGREIVAGMRNARSHQRLMDLIAPCM